MRVVIRTMAAMKDRRHDPDEVRRLLQIRKAEKLSYRELSARSGVPIHVLTHRAHRDARATRSTTSQPSTFVEVVARGDKPMRRTESGVELLLGQVRIRLDCDFDQATLARLLTTIPC